MNRDSHLIFEAYLNEMATRLVPGKSTSAGETQVTFPEKAAKYSLTPDQTKQVIEQIVSKLGELNGYFEKSDKEFQKDFIAPIIKDVAGKNLTLSTYAARVIHTALKKAGVVSADAGEGTTLEDPSIAAQDEAADDVPEVVADTQPTAAEQSPESNEQDQDIEEVTVYHKSADFQSDDAELEKAWRKLPANKDLDWTQVCKIVGASVGMKLIDAGALNEEIKKKEVGEGDYSEGDTGEVTQGISDEDLSDLSNIADRGADSYGYKGSPFRYSHD